MAGSVAAVHDSGGVIGDERAAHEQVRGTDAAASLEANTVVDSEGRVHIHCGYASGCRLGNESNR